jgi:uncharacterized membrane protein
MKQRLTQIFVILLLSLALLPGSLAAQQSDSNATPDGSAATESASSTEADAEPALSEAESMKADIKRLFPQTEDKGVVKAIGKAIGKAIEREKSDAFIKNDAVIFGILMTMLGFIFWTSNSEHRFWRGFYKVVPMLLVCYFLPSLLTFFEVVDHKISSLYYVATRFLLPTTLVLLTLSIDLKEIFRLGPKALIMFLTGTVGVVVGGPIAVTIVAFLMPDLIGVDGPEAVWRGLSTVAGSWIGGGANQAAMQGIYMDFENAASTQLEQHYRSMFSVMVAVDVIVAEVWMLFLLLGVDRADQIDRFLKADSSSIERLKNKMEDFSLSVARIPSSKDLMVLGAIGFGGTALAHYIGADLASYVGDLVSRSNADALAESGDAAVRGPLNFLADLGLDSSFFWLIVISTTVGIILSFTPMRRFEGAGASKIGTVFIFILVAVIGMGMDISALTEYPGFFLIGGIWMAFHVGLMFFMSWLIKAPYFFLAVGSKANIGGAASAPVVAAAFHPALAPVGVLLAVLGYALGTYGAIACAKMMQMATPIGG